MATKVLTYHKVDKSEFAEQVAFLRGRNDVLVTFDDGYESVYTDALPVLRDAGIRAIAFVNPGLVGEQGRMDIMQINELARAGVRIGNHGWSHKPFAILSKPEIENEYLRARDWISANVATNAAPEVFALPKGSEDENTRDILRGLGAKEIYGSERIDVYPGRSLRYFRWSLNPLFQWLRRHRI